MITWKVIENWFDRTVCGPNRSGGCSHPRCHRANNLQAVVANLVAGNDADVRDVEEVAAFLQSNTCQSQRNQGVCSHQGCNNNANLANWVLQHAYQYQRAA